MNSMVRERKSHAVPLFIAVTPEIRRALEMLAEASISLLDEIDAPADALEPVGDDEPSLGWTSTARGVVVPDTGTDDREFDDSDLEEDDAAEIDDPGEDGGEEEPDLGWTVDGSNLGEGEVDFLPPEASGDFNRADYASEFNNVAQKAAFKRPDRRQAWRANRWFIADETNRIRELLFYRAVRQKAKKRTRS